MKKCLYCGAENPDYGNYCEKCGTLLGEAQEAEVAAVPSFYKSNDLTEKELEVIKGMKRNFRREQKAYRIFSIIYIVLIAIYLLLGVLVLALGVNGSGSGTVIINGNTVTDPAVVNAFFIIWLICWFSALLFVFLPIAIIGLVAANRINNYLGTIDENVRPSRKRAAAIGMIVFSAIFNQIAMIFVIMNFVYVKKRKAILDSITEKQKLRNLGI